MFRFFQGIVSCVISLCVSFCLIVLPVHAQTQSQYGTVKRGAGGVAVQPGGIKNLSDQGSGDAKEANVYDQYPGAMGGNQINIHVLGDVSAPGVYKVNVSERAADVVKRAGLKRTTVRVIQLRHPGEPTKSFDLYKYYYFGDLKHNPFLKDNDTIFVPEHNGAVRIEGSVARPGVYELFGEKNLDQIIHLAGGLSHGMSQMQPIKVIRFSDGGNKFVLDVVQEKSTLKRFNIIKGDIIIIPDMINAATQFDYTVETIPGEQLVYPTATPEVFVIGTVSNPGPYPYKSHLTIKDYLGYAGASAEANFNYVKVFRDGRRKNKKLYEKVRAGDVIIVREKQLNTVLKYVGIGSTLLGVTLSAFILRDALNNDN